MNSPDLAGVRAWAARRDYSIFANRSFWADVSLPAVKLVPGCKCEMDQRGVHGGGRELAPDFAELIDFFKTGYALQGMDFLFSPLSRTPTHLRRPS